VPLAFSTGYGEHGVGEGYGHHLVLNKPYSSRQFIAVLTALLAAAGRSPSRHANSSDGRLFSPP